MAPVWMLAPLSDVFLVMRAEVLTIFRAEMIFRPPLVVVVAIVVTVAIVRALFLILRSATIISGSVLRHRCACEKRQSGSQHDSM